LIARALKQAAEEVQEYVRLVAAGVRAAFSRPRYSYDIIEQFDLIGVRSLNVVLMTGFFTGGVLALQSGLTLDAYGARPIVGRLVTATMVKNLGPVLTGLMLCGRVGSSIAAELGSMVATDQVNALRVLGTDPVRKLVVPRLLAGTIMTPVLTVVADAVAIVGGWVVAVYQLRVASGLYWSSVWRVLSIQDLWMGLSKPVFLGFFIVSVGCHVGLRTTGGTQGVGKSTTKAVVAGSVGVIAIDFFLTRIMISLWY
jgi:phospholipid/cholesterol/gamma-HCH transport system permease protein